MIKLKLSYGDLETIEVDALSRFGSKILELDFAHNKLSQIPNGFFTELSYLEILNLSGNNFVTLDLSSMLYVHNLVLDNSPILKALTLDTNDTVIGKKKLKLFRISKYQTK